MFLGLFIMNLISFVYIGHKSDSLDKIMKSYSQKKIMKSCCFKILCTICSNLTVKKFILSRVPHEFTPYFRDMLKTLKKASSIIL